MTLDYNLERDRLATFSNWESEYAETDLAQCGFRYLGASDVVECHSCGIRISRMEIDDDIRAVHENHSPRCPLFKKLSHNVPPGDYNYEVERFATFEGWENQRVTAAELACCGFIYSGKSDLVTCHFCGIKIQLWKNSDTVYAEHVKHSPKCPLLTYAKYKNVPLNEDVFKHKVPKLTINTVDAGDKPAERKIHAPQFEALHRRQNSYEKWPKYLKQRPERLSAAGFYYEGKNDEVTCYSCGGVLNSWNIEDDEYDKHSASFPDCELSKKYKMK